MLTGVPKTADEHLNAHLRAVNIILSWPCKDCGKAYPCPCDTAENSLLSTIQDRGTISGNKSGRALVQPQNAALGSSTVSAA